MGSAAAVGIGALRNGVGFEADETFDGGITMDVIDLYLVVSKPILTEDLVGDSFFAEGGGVGAAESNDNEADGEGASILDESARRNAGAAETRLVNSNL